MFIKKLRKKAAASVRPTVKLDKVLKVFNINYIFLIIYLDHMAIRPNKFKKRPLENLSGKEINTQTSISSLR